MSQQSPPKTPFVEKKVRRLLGKADERYGLIEPDDRILVAQNVVVHTDKGPLHGVVGSKPVHIQKDEERRKVMEADSLFIDVGAKNKEEAEKMGVQVGDVVSFDTKFVQLGNGAVLGKAFDDRVGCAMLVEVLRKVPKVDCNLYVVGTIQEEVGLRGATIAAFQIKTTRLKRQ